ncbi:MAG TPA: nickel-responsive transcriptional regulator NikR [Bacillota bacterium]|nr:nickel-responsive transcriptional regulator NikR [Bacillota bacterium]
MSELVRFGISMDRELLERFDREIVSGNYANRSEAIRDLIRNQLVESEWSGEDAEVAGTITLVYDHHVRGLNDLLLDVQHQYHNLILSVMHVHLTHNNCLEVMVIRGPARTAREVAGRLLGVKGVKHGKLTITSTGERLK